MANQSAPRSGPINRNTFFWLAAVTALLAVGVHLYLYMQHLAIESGEFTKSICDINEKFDCTSVSMSKYAEFLNVPVALWGTIANLIFLVLGLAILPLSDDSKKEAARRNVFICALGIFLATIVMASISLFLLSKFCLFCMTAYVLSILMLIFTWLWLRDDRALFANVKFGDFTPLIVCAVVGFVGGFITQSTMAPGANSPEQQAELNGMVNQWKAASTRDFKLVAPLTAGPENAKMTIVEFADYRCIHCKHASPVFHTFVSSHPDVKFEFQPWPLDGECNSALQQANGASCLLARVSYCADKLKHAGWDVHDYIYDLPEIFPSVEAVRAALPDLAKAGHMTNEELASCADSDEAKTIVRQQAEVGQSINLEGTPTVYANQKLLQGGQVLQVLQKAYDSL